MLGQPRNAPAAGLSLSSRVLTSEGWPLLILLGLVSGFWWPALWHAQVLLHVDAAHHSLSLLSILQQAIFNGRELLWDSTMYGGHPLFAESQGGFLSPFNLLCAYLFEPVYGLGVLRWLNMLASGLGSYWLARCLAVRPWSALFASLVVVFSGAWIEFQYNLSVSAVLAWLPALIASAEYWLSAPSPRRALLMAAAAAMLVLAGYPHVTYGAALYLAVRVGSALLWRSSRQTLWHQRGTLLRQGSLAVLLALGFSAVQWLPLLELVGQSHRSEGVTMVFAGLIPLSSYLKSLLMFNSDPMQSSLVVGCLSSALCALLVSLLICAKTPPRVISHLLAGVVLLNLGMEMQSPLFRLLYEHHLLPGLHSFRIMHPFMPLAVLGLAMAAAYSLDHLPATLKRIRQQRHLQVIAGALAVAWAGLLIALYEPSLSLYNQLEPLLFVLLVGLLLLLRRAHWLPAMAVLLYGAGVLLYKGEAFIFHERDVLSPPSTVSHLMQDPTLSEFKTTFEPRASEFSLLPSNHPQLATHYRRYLTGLAPSPMASLGIASLDGNLALPLAARMQVQQQLQEEIAGHSTSAVGSRLMDVLGLKYIPLAAPSHNSSLLLEQHDAKNAIYLYRNLYAQPRWQLYSHVLWADSSSAAQALLKQTQPGQLVLQGAPIPNTAGCNEASPAAHFKVLHSSAMHHQVQVNTPCPTWLFLADANYPGWQARLNGQPTPVYSAQVLGKAVAVPAGEQQIQLDYVPRSFHIGLGLSLLSVLLGAVIAWRSPRSLHE